MHIHIIENYKTIEKNEQVLCIWIWNDPWDNLFSEKPRCKRKSMQYTTICAFKKKRKNISFICMKYLFKDTQDRITLVTFEEGNWRTGVGRGGTLPTLLELSNFESTNTSPI